MDVRVASSDNARNGGVPIVETTGESEGQSVMETQHRNQDENRSSGTAAVDRESCDASEASFKESTDSQEKRADSDSERENLNSIVRGERAEADLPRKMQQGGISSPDDLRLQEPLPGEVDFFATTQLEQKPGAGVVKEQTPVAGDENFAVGVDSFQDKGGLEKAQSSVLSHSTASVSCTPVTNDVEDSTLRDMDVEGQKEEERVFSVKEDEKDSTFIKSVDLDSVPGPRLSGEAERVTDWLWTLHRIGK